jgi:hypothetical protein
MAKVCPRCKLKNPNSAMRCDCGYELVPTAPSGGGLDGWLNAAAAPASAPRAKPQRPEPQPASGSRLALWYVGYDEQTRTVEWTGLVADGGRGDDSLPGLEPCLEQIRAVAKTRRDEDGHVVEEVRVVFPHAWMAVQQRQLLESAGARAYHVGENEQLVAATALDDRMLLPRLRASDWPGWAEIPGRALLEMPGVDAPRVAVGEDSATRFTYVQHDDLAGRAFAEWEAIAVANLKMRAAALRTVGTRLELVDEFACERVLDADLMRRAHAALRVSHVVVAVPVRGILWIASLLDPAGVSELVALARASFAKPEQLEPVSPVVFTVRDGAIVGTLDSSAGAR